MAHFTAGDLLEDQFRVVTPDNTAITGLALGSGFTVISATAPDGTNIAGGITVAELGNGVYRASYQTTVGQVSGIYSLFLDYTGALPRTFEFEWDVKGDALTTAPTIQPVLLGTIMRNIRRDVLSLIGDLTVVTATSQVSDSEFRDVDHVTLGSGNYAGRELIVTSGQAANIGQKRRVTSSNEGSLIVNRPFPAAPTLGDEAELLNTFGLGITHDDVMRQIRTSIAFIRPTVQMVTTLTTGFSSSQRDFTIPEDFISVDRIEYRNPQATMSSWEELPPAQSHGGYGWFVDRVQRLVSITGHAGYTLSGTGVRLYGLGYVAEPVNDTDLVSVDREWLMYEVASAIAGRPMHYGGQNAQQFQQWGLEWKQRANSLRVRIVPRPLAGRRMLV